MKIALSIGHHPDSQGVNLLLDPETSEYLFWKEHISKIKDHLERCGHEAVITNRGDAGGKTPIYAAYACNATRADLAIEFHFNSSSGVSGTETFYWYSSEKGKLAARCLQQAMVTILGLRDRGIKPISAPDDRGYNYFKKTQMPAILLEPAFAADSAEDCKRLTGRIDDLCIAIAEAVNEYFSRVSELEHQ